MDTYEIRIVLRDTDPPVWRRLQVPAGIALGQLHRVIQAAMGWRDLHLHRFVADGVAYGVSDEEFPTDMKSEAGVWLDSLAGPGDRLSYEYDFGDGWVHEIEIERALAAEPGTHYPRCAGGARACPPEDCGGPPGYAALLEVLRRGARNEDEADLLAWLGEDFDPKAFDPATVNAALRCLK